MSTAAITRKSLPERFPNRQVPIRVTSSDEQRHPNTHAHACEAEDNELHEAGMGREQRAIGSPVRPVVDRCSTDVNRPSGRFLGTWRLYGETVGSPGIRNAGHRMCLQGTPCGRLRMGRQWPAGRGGTVRPQVRSRRRG